MKCHSKKGHLIKTLTWKVAQLRKIIFVHFRDDFENLILKLCFFTTKYAPKDFFFTGPFDLDKAYSLWSITKKSIWTPSICMPCRGFNSYNVKNLILKVLLFLLFLPYACHCWQYCTPADLQSSWQSSLTFSAVVSGPLSVQWLSSNIRLGRTFGLKY